MTLLAAPSWSTIIRVLHIIPTLDRGGAERQLATLVSRIDRDRFDPHVCVLTRDGPLHADLDAAGVPVTVIGKRWTIDPVAYRKLVHTIRRLQPQVVQTWLFAGNSYGRQAALQAGVSRLIATERCIDPWKRWHQWAIDRYLTRRTERIVVNSDAIRRFCVGHKLPSEKFTLIPNGIDAARFDLPGDRQRLLSELQLPDDARLIGLVGRLWPQKRIKDAIFALDLLKSVRDDVHLLIIGEGPMRWRLTRFRDQLELRGRVHFLGERNDVPQLLRSLDLLWLASAYEGMPNAIMEAMAAELPVVATDIPGNRDLVLPEKTGYLVPVGDRAGLARWTQPLLDKPDLAREFGKAARQRIETEFQVEKMVSAYERLYCGTSDV